jgi:hypothetical protein
MLVSIPILCGMILLLLIYVFAELNLYFLEANGLVIDSQVREGYFEQVIMEMGDLIGYLGLQLLTTFVAAVVVMRWATAPFTSAHKNLKLVIENKEPAVGRARWFSESPVFDELIGNFALGVRTGEMKAAVKPQGFGNNYPFLLKFMLTFGVLSLSTGYVMSIIMSSVYRRIVEIALQTVKSTQFVGHYFNAQLEILQKANYFTVGLSLVLYGILGWQISRYMGMMIFKFSRAIHEDKFPIALRSSDVYLELAETLNEGRRRIK